MSTDIELWKATVEEQLGLLRGQLDAFAERQQQERAEDLADFKQRKEEAEAKTEARYREHCEREDTRNALLERIAFALERHP